ncbi:MAG: hypothetical protein PUC82_00450 [bacterium]|nr:hypothetical protein [bacterium]
MKNDVIKTLTYPGVDLNELIEAQAKQQSGVVPHTAHDSKQFNGQGQNLGKGKVYQKTRSNSVKRHK